LEAIKQRLYYVNHKNKIKLLLHILDKKEYTSVLVFSRTKHGANKIAKELRFNHVPTLEIHGNKSQGARTEALSQFKSHLIRVLVATDIAARGLDIEGLSLVVQYDLPDVPETYIHRIGRTGRAGLDGIAILFCEEEELGQLQAIHKHLKMNIPLVTDHPYKEKYDDLMKQNQPVKPIVPSKNTKKTTDNHKNYSQHKSIKKYAFFYGMNDIIDEDLGKNSHFYR